MPSTAANSADMGTSAPYDFQTPLMDMVRTTDQVGALARGKVRQARCPKVGCGRRASRHVSGLCLRHLTSHQAQFLVEAEADLHRIAREVIAPIALETLAEIMMSPTASEKDRANAAQVGLRAAGLVNAPQVEVNVQHNEISGDALATLNERLDQIRSRQTSRGEYAMGEVVQSRVESDD